MDRVFSALGKFFLVLLLLIIVLGAGYYIGTAKNKPQNPTTPKINPTVSIVTSTPSASPTASLMPTKEENKKTISAGLSSGTSFVPYTIQIPSSWSNKHETTPSVMDKLTLSFDTYSVIIFQAAIGGGGCLYKGDPPQQMAQNFTNSVEFSGINTYRRSWNTDANNTHISYTICQKGTDNSYSSITQFGKIDVVSPNPADDAIMKEIDTMIASIKKQ